MATADSVANPHQREEQLVSGGVYTIHPHHSENNCFCVEEDANGRYVVNLRPVHRQSLKQRFIAQQHTDGTWSFLSKELQGAHALDSLVLDDAVCIMSPFNEGGKTNQKFHIRPVEEGGPWVNIRASWDDNVCLDINRGGHEGASVNMWNVIDDRARAMHQEFRFHRATDTVANPHQRVSGGVYIIRPHHSEDNCFCVEEEDKNYVLKLRPVHLQLPEQRFIAEQHTQHGTWSFRSKALKKPYALDSLGLDDAVCIMSPFNEGGSTTNQQFHIRPVEKGGPWVNIRVSWDDNVCLNIKDQGHEGASVNTWGFIEDLHQEFCFDRVVE